MNTTIVLSMIQGNSYVIMLGKWWQVLPILIAFIVGVVWLMMWASLRKHS